MRDAMIASFIGFFALLLAIFIVAGAAINKELFSNSIKNTWLSIKVASIDWPQPKPIEEVKLPDLQFPKLEMPELNMPSFDLALPDIEMPNVEIPIIATPKIAFPEIKIPNIEIPDIPNISAEIETLAYSITDFGRSVIAGIAKADQKIVSAKNEILNVPLDDPPEFNDTEVSFALEQSLNEIEPAVGMVEEPEGAFADSGYYEIEEPVLNTEGVLVPQEKTVISSSRDGKIKKIYVSDGDLFRKGERLVEYYCDDAESEARIARLEKEFNRQKLITSSKLLNLDLISTIEKEEAAVETKQAQARVDLVKSKLNDCVIHATYDGRVVKRLANDNEYTRTDRVLLEIASKDKLDIEFLMPSKWLRWVNIGAPISVLLNETDKVYEGEVNRIYGEVDPISQSIQIRASLDPYEDKLLPGMSGTIEIDAYKIQKADVLGYLERKTEQK